MQWHAEASSAIQAAPELGAAIQAMGNLTTAFPEITWMTPSGIPVTISCNTMKGQNVMFLQPQNPPQVMQMQGVPLQNPPQGMQMQGVPLQNSQSAVVTNKGGFNQALGKGQNAIIPQPEPDWYGEYEQTEYDFSNQAPYDGKKGAKKGKGKKSGFGKAYQDFGGKEKGKGKKMGFGKPHKGGGKKGKKKGGQSMEDLLGDV